MRMPVRPPEAKTLPSVTVVIPCYRYGHYLPEAVARTLAQPGVAVEIVIVDDASPDGSGEVAETLAEGCPNVSVIRHHKNLGHIATYNDGLSVARGDYVVLLSADDLLAPGALVRATSMLENHPQVGLVYGHVETFDETPPAVEQRRISWSIWNGDKWLERVIRRGMNVITCPEAVLRRSVLEEIGGYDAALPHTADLYMWLKAAARSAVGRVNGPTQAFYRVHGANMHLTDYKDVLSDIRHRANTFEMFLDGAYAEHPRRAACQQYARRGVALEAIRWGIVACDRREDGWRMTMDRAARFAQDAWPEITGERVWKRFQSRQQGVASTIDRVTFRRTEDLRYRLRWQRWRKFGT